MSVSLSATVDVRDVDRAIEEMLRAGHNLGPAFRIAKPIMRADQREHASRRMGPDGPWPQRAASSLAKARRGRKRTRKPLGKLPTATTYTATSTGLRAVSRVPWSGAHQFGARVGRGAQLPARPFLWISDELAGKVASIFATHVVS